MPLESTHTNAVAPGGPTHQSHPDPDPHLQNFKRFQPPSSRGTPSACGWSELGAAGNHAVSGPLHLFHLAVAQKRQQGAQLRAEKLDQSAAASAVSVTTATLLVTKRSVFAEVPSAGFTKHRSDFGNAVFKTNIVVGEVVVCRQKALIVWTCGLVHESDRATLSG